MNYLNAIIKRLDLKDISAIHNRVEDYAKLNPESFEIVTARAVANLSTLLGYCIPLVKTDGYFVAMKGHVEDELQDFKRLSKQYKCTLEKKEEFCLPIEGSVRNLLKIRKREKTPILSKKIVKKSKKML